MLRQQSELRDSDIDIPGADAETAVAQLKRMSTVDVEYLEELVDLVADEVETFTSEIFNASHQSHSAFASKINLSFWREEKLDYSGRLYS